MNRQPEQRNIKIEDLILDIDNPRFAELYSKSSAEDDLIEYLFVNEGANEIAQNIIDRDLFYPDEFLWVVKKGNKFLVKDGNRRCAAVKALREPQNYNLELKPKRIDELPALVFQDEEYLNQRMLEKHVSPSIKSWTRIAKALHAYKQFKGGASMSTLRKRFRSDPLKLIQLASFYYEATRIKGDDFRELVRSGKGAKRGKTIIFERLFKYSDDYGYTFQPRPDYIIEIKDQNRFESYINALVEYIKEHPKLTSRTIDNGAFTLEDLEKYSSPLSTSRNRSKHPVYPKSSLRKYLIPEKCELSIKNSKINNIYHELRGDLLIDDSKKAVPNAVGVLFRVFLEVSLDKYIAIHGIKVEKGLKPMAQSRATIRMKIEAVVDDLELKYKSTNFKHINKVRTAPPKDGVLSIQNFHDYVHCLKSEPASNDLKTVWDLLQEFFEILWEEINNNE